MNGRGRAVRYNTEQEAEDVASAYTARTGNDTTVMSLGQGGGGPVDFWFIACGSLDHVALMEDDVQGPIDNS